MNTTQRGREAEQIAADYLKERGFVILEHNWKLPQCEIDIVAQKGPVKYFVECKYRRSDTFGSGFAYLTPRKLAQMEFAARMWVHVRAWDGAYFLSAIELVGEPPSVKNFIPII